MARSPTVASPLSPPHLLPLFRRRVPIRSIPFTSSALLQYHTIAMLYVDWARSARPCHDRVRSARRSCAPPTGVSFVFGSPTFPCSPRSPLAAIMRHTHGDVFKPVICWTSSWARVGDTDSLKNKAWLRDSFNAVWARLLRLVRGCCVCAVLVSSLALGQKPYLLPSTCLPHIFGGMFVKLST